MWLAGSYLFLLLSKTVGTTAAAAVWKHLLSNKLNSSEDHLAEDSFNRLLWNYCHRKRSLDSRSEICFVIIRLLRCICLPGYILGLSPTYTLLITPTNPPKLKFCKKIEDWIYAASRWRPTWSLLSLRQGQLSDLQVRWFSVVFDVIYFQVSYISSDLSQSTRWYQAFPSKWLFTSTWSTFLVGLRLASLSFSQSLHTKQSIMSL